MKRQALLLLGLALIWLMASSAALAEDAAGDQPPEPPRKGPRARRTGPSSTTPAAPPTKAFAKAPAKAPTRPPAKPPAKPPKPVKGALAKGEPKEDEEEGEEGSVFVLPDKDAVILRDGTRVNGTILCAGQAAVTILTAEGEKTISREQIERVIQNADAGVPEKFKAEELDGHKYLKKEDAEEPPPVKAGGPAAPPIATLGMPPGAPPQPAPAAEKGGAEAPAPAAAPKALPPAPPKAPPPVAPVQPPAALEPPAAGPLPQPPAALPTMTLPKDPAQLRAFIEQLRRDGKLDALLKDPRALEALRKALREKAAQ